MTDQHHELPALPLRAGGGQHGTMVPLTQAALLLGVSVATARRRLRKGELDGAELQQGPHGDTWFVPLATIESLRAAGRPTPTPARSSAASPELLGELAALTEQVRLLELELARERALAQERHDQLTELHETVRTLAALTAGPPAPPDAPVRRRRWLRKG